MEYINEIAPFVPDVILPEEQAAEKHFITANTIAGNLYEMKTHHLIPVFSKDNEPTISHTDFIESVQAITADIYQGEHILKPLVRLSHPIKGRVPEAKNKAANELFEWEKTIYYERMAFAIEIPSVQAEIDGNILSLTVGGVKSYSLDNLYSKNNCDQHFKIFVGFKNQVCCNMCVWTDGFMGDVKVKSLGQLRAMINTLLQSYNSQHHLFHLEQLANYSITEKQFAQLIGRCRMYPHLPQDFRRDVSPLLFGDQQMSSVVKDFYKDDSFCRDSNGNINLWRLYNLFTGANKSSYIDSFLDRSVNAYQLVEQIKWGLEGKNSNWYLN
jgi:hypothetical protein